MFFIPALAQRHRAKALVYGDFRVLSRKKNRFVYERVLGNEVYLIGCNLGKKPCKTYVKADKQWKLIYDTAEQKGSSGAAKNLRGYEARIWKN